MEVVENHDYLVLDTSALFSNEVYARNKRSSERYNKMVEEVFNGELKGKLVVSHEVIMEAGRLLGYNHISRNLKVKHFDYNSLGDLYLRMVEHFGPIAQDYFVNGGHDNHVSGDISSSSLALSLAQISGSKVAFLSADRRLCNMVYEQNELRGSGYLVPDLRLIPNGDVGVFEFVEDKGVYLPFDISVSLKPLKLIKLPYNPTGKSKSKIVGKKRNLIRKLKENRRA
jgi:hypothetical protein